MICDIHGCELSIETYYQVPYCPECSRNPRNPNADQVEVQGLDGMPIVKIDIDVPTLN